MASQRLGKHFVCCTFYAAGVNHFWAMDQHDKWLRFGLHWHGCIEGFTGKIIWLTVWWNNSNLKYVCGQYLKAVKQFGVFFIAFLVVVELSNGYILGAPCVTQSDWGTENFNVAYAHTHIWHSLDPTLAGSIQHQWKRGHTNIKPEQMWSRFRKTWVPGFERLLDKGIQRQWYNVINITDRCVTVLHVIDTCLRVYALYCLEIGLCFVGWPSLGSSGRRICMCMATTPHAEGHAIGRCYPQVFRMSCLKTQKASTLLISR